MNFYAFNIGDYAGATRHLSWDEDMAYRRMLDAYYSREAPLPLERRALYRLVGASEPRQREAVDAVLLEFFDEREDGWHNNRADEEIAKTATKKQKAQQSAAMRWQNEAQSDRNANASKKHANASEKNANAMPTQCEGNAPNPNPNPNKDDDEGIARRRELFARTEGALRSIPEIAGHPIAVNPVIAPVYQLALEKGLDLDTQIIPSIRRQLSTAKGSIRNWAYFVDGILRDAEPSTPATAGARPHGPFNASRASSAKQELRDAVAAVQAAVAAREGGA